jgi:hypothetical protein
VFGEPRPGTVNSHHPQGSTIPRVSAPWVVETFSQSSAASRPLVLLVGSDIAPLGWIRHERVRFVG